MGPEPVSLPRLPPLSASLYEQGDLIAACPLAFALISSGQRIPSEGTELVTSGLSHPIHN